MPPKKRARPSSGASSAEEENLHQLSFNELRERLVEIGENPGPIDASNKGIYVRLLAKKKLKIETTVTSSSLPDTSLTRSPLSQSVLFSGAGASRTKRTPTAAGRSSAAKSRAAKTTPANDFSQFEVHGLVAATFTPLSDNGDINPSVIPVYADYLVKSCVTSIFVNGTTGQGLCLTVGERKQLAEEWVRVAKGRIKVIVHVGTECVKDTCELASHAQAIGAAAIGVQPPICFKPATIEHLVCYLEKVGQASPNLPMFYYHIPDCTGVHLNMEDFLEAASTRLPTLVGLKYADADLHTFSQCLTSNGGNYQALYGRDEQLLGALSMGAIAAVGSTYNYMGKLNNRILGSFKANSIDHARFEQRRAGAAVKLLFKYGGGVSVGKAILRLQGIDTGPPRLPLLPLAPEAFKNLEADLRDIGFFEWA